MTTLINASGGGVIAPDLLLGYEAAREARSNIHPIIGSSTPDVTLRPASLREGELSIGFSGATSESASKAAADLLGTAVLFTLSDTDRASIAMTFAVQGRISRALEDVTRGAWVVTFGFAEVSA